MVSSTEDILLNNRSDLPAHLALIAQGDKVVFRATEDSTPVISVGSTQSRSFDRYMFVFLALMTPLWAVGCSSGGQTLPPISGFTAETALEWHDLDAAVVYVAAREGLALVKKMTVQIDPANETGQAVRRYELIDIRDRPIEIRFSTDPGALAGLRGASATRSGSVVVQVGRFGDDQREQAIVGALLKRLDTLALID